MDNGYLSTDEALAFLEAHKYKRSLPWLKKMTQLEKIPVMKKNGRNWYHKKDLRAVIKNKLGLEVVIKALALSFLLASPAHAQVPEALAVKVLVAEAANQGFDGMLAVAEVIRRRGKADPASFCALKRKDLDAFISRQPARVHANAKKAWAESAASDITKGATHYENVKAYGVPYWAKSMTVTATIKDHVFYKEAK